MCITHKYNIDCVDDCRQRISAPRPVTPSARKHRRSLRSGYAFAHQEGFGRLITSGKLVRRTIPHTFPVTSGVLRPTTSNTL